jgi:hypothetical protein
MIGALMLPLTPPRGWVVARTVPARTRVPEVVSAGDGVGGTSWKELIKITVPMGTRYYIVGVRAETLDDPHTLQVYCDLWFNGVSILEGDTRLIAPDGEWVSIYRDVGGGTLQLMGKNIAGTTEPSAAADNLHYLVRGEILGVQLRRGR